MISVSFKTFMFYYHSIKQSEWNKAYEKINFFLCMFYWRVNEIQ